MPRTLGPTSSRARYLAATVLCASALIAASGCSDSDDKFTAGEAGRANAALDAVLKYVNEGRCGSAESRVRVLAVQSTRINEDRRDLGEAYASSVARLQELVARECVEITEPEPTEEVSDPTGPTPEPTATPRPDPAPEPEPEPEPTGGGAPGQPDPDPGDSGGASPL